MSFENDTYFRDSLGNKRVSFGPRRLDSVAADAQVEPCAVADAAFWGVYTHDAEGLASIVGDAHDQESAKLFSLQVSRNLELEARLFATTSPARPTTKEELLEKLEELEVSALMGRNALGFTGADDDGLRNMMGRLANHLEALSQLVDSLPEPKEEQRFIVLTIDTNHASFDDLGRTIEASRLFRSAASQLESGTGLDGDTTLYDTNGNYVGSVRATRSSKPLSEERPGMIRLVVDAGEDLAFGTTEATKIALVRSFRYLADQLDGVKDFSKRMSSFTAEVQEAPYERHSPITTVKVGHFHYTPMPELVAEPKALDAAELDI